MNDQADFIIIGQGIAGTCLAWTLISENKKIIIIDDGHKTAASRAAAGILNPLTGIKLVKSWQSDQQFDWAQQFYTGLEKDMGIPFFQKRKLIRIFRYEKEVRQWEKRLQQSEYQSLLGPRYKPGELKACLNDPIGSFEVNHAASIDIIKFLDSSRSQFNPAGHKGRLHHILPRMAE